MRYRLEVGVYEPAGEINPNTGESINSFVPKFTVWAGTWSINQEQQIALDGAGIKNALMFFVRHNPNITDKNTLRLGDNEFTIDNINYDDGLTANSYDIITCHERIEDHG